MPDVPGDDMQGERLRYALDEQMLVRLGYELMSQGPSHVVVVSEEVAEAAMAAWEREEDGPSAPDLTLAEKRTRDAAATLALIGLGLSERGTRLPDGSFSIRLDSAQVDEVIHTCARGIEL